MSTHVFPECIETKVHASLHVYFGYPYSNPLISIVNLTVFFWPKAISKQTFFGEATKLRLLFILVLSFRL